jgi:type IV secretory pathway VirJ component
MRTLAVTALSVLAAVRVCAGPPAEVLDVPGVGKVSLYAPQGEPTQVVLFVSGDGGWNLGVIPMAERLRDLGALVAGIDIRSFQRSLEAGTGCAYPAGALEELSRSVQLRRRLPEYRRPILVGYSSGATLVYAALAAAPSETFAGAISLGFCPDIETTKPPCAARGLVPTRKTKGVGFDLAPFPGMTVPWRVLQGEIDQVCSPAVTRDFVGATGQAKLYSLPKVGHGFSVTRNWDAQYVEAYKDVAALREAARRAAAAPPAEAAVADLPLVEVPAETTGSSDVFAVILTGDGGWAEIDKGIAQGLAAAGVPSVGWSSLRYYWTPRTPEAAAADLQRIVESYASRWKRQRVVLVGYSFGADVLPFLVNRLPEPTRGRIARVALLGLSDTAAFEFHVSSWLGGGGDPERATKPEVERSNVPMLCIQGGEEKDSACAGLRGPNVRVLVVPGGHHFGGDYPRLAALMLAPSESAR